MSVLHLVRAVGWRGQGVSFCLPVQGAPPELGLSSSFQSLQWAPAWVWRYCLEIQRKKKRGENGKKFGRKGKKFRPLACAEALHPHCPPRPQAALIQIGSKVQESGSLFTLPLHPLKADELLEASWGDSLTMTIHREHVSQPEKCF